MHQVYTIIRRKRLDLYDKRPGAVAGNHTKIIFVRMLRRIGHFHENSWMNAIHHLRPRFNDALNDAVAKIGHYMLIVNTCNGFEDYDHFGNLSHVGRVKF